jgi:hypothetical protein
MNKLAKLIADRPPKKRIVELTPTGPVLIQSAGELSSVTAFESYEVDDSTWNELQQALQTGQLDNATVKDVIKAKQE